MAIALVSNVSKSTPGTSAAIDTTGADFIVLLATSTGTINNIPTDSKSNKYIILGYSGNSTARTMLYGVYAPSVGAGHTFTVAAGTFAAFCVLALSGTGGFPIYSVIPTNISASANSLTPGSVTPPVNNCIVLAGLGYRDTTTVFVTGGFTISDQQPFASGTAVGVAFAYLIQTSAAASNPSFSWTTASPCTAIQMVIQPPAVGSAGGGSYGFA